MPELVFDYVTSKHPRYIKKYSKTADETYFANVCECGANFGDFYLFSEPEGAFFPVTEKDAASIRIIEMPFEGQFEFECSWSEGSGSLILKHGALVED